MKRVGVTVGDQLTALGWAKAKLGRAPAGLALSVANRGRQRLCGQRWHHTTRSSKTSYECLSPFAWIPNNNSVPQCSLPAHSVISESILSKVSWGLEYHSPVVETLAT